MKNLYPEGPTNVPLDLTKPTKKFKRNIALAIAGLIIFLGTYFTLMIWFAYRSYTMFSSLQYASDNKFITFILALVIGILSVFMFKSLIIFKKKDDFKPKYITKEQEPDLFDFINRIADDASAPRPHKIVLTDRVNASVFYDLSLINLIFPSKKNLEIGLGLVNVLNLGEFKAVLAHEFGHFAQKSMMLGRYVYTSQQIAQQVVNKRDALDAFLAGLSRFDLRLAWIGWILSILVWAIRALIEVLFGVVVIAERALSREMEFQADLVSVSLTGSDDLINALSKLKGADEAYHASINSLNNRLLKKELVPDLYTLQTNYIKQMRVILNDKSFADTPANFQEGKLTTVFTELGINPPELWSTHPANEDREKNAKNYYIASKIDHRDSWILFQNPDETRKIVTANGYVSLDKKDDFKLISEEESVEKMNHEEFNWTFLKSKYKGVFLGRLAFARVESENDMYQANVSSNLQSVYAQLYPDSLTHAVEDIKRLNIEKSQLTSVMYEAVTIEKRKIYFRGEEIKRTKVKSAIEKIDEEIEIEEAKLTEHDKLCRTLNLKVAETFGVAYSTYHKSISCMIHYTEHMINSLEYKFAKFNNSLQIATAGGRSSDEQVRAVVTDASRLGNLLEKIYTDSTSIIVDQTISKKLGADSYAELYEPYRLGDPNTENINQWIQSLEGWLHIANKGLYSLRNASLERLLDVEQQLEEAYVNKKELDLTVGKIEVSNPYSPLMPESKAELEFNLSFWDRFLAGYGLVPSTAKFLIAGFLIWGTVVAASLGQNYQLIIYNGLDTDVDIKIDENSYHLIPNDKKTVEIEYGHEYHISAHTSKGELIEDFETEMLDRNPIHVYNVANAAYMIEYTVSYGYESFAQDRLIGPSRWFTSSAEYLFTEAPASIMSQSSGSTKDVLTAYKDIDPWRYGLDMTDPNTAIMIENHAKWDDENSKFLNSWMVLATSVDSTMKFAEYRLKRNPIEIAVLRHIQNYSDEKKLELCNTTLAELIKKHPAISDLKYLMVRCSEDNSDKDQAFIQGYLDHPESEWFAYSAAYVYAENEEWAKSYDAYVAAADNNSMLTEYVALDFERIRRAVDIDLQNSTHDYILLSTQSVTYIRGLEEGDEEILYNNPEAAYFHLNKGDLETAQLEVNKNSQEWIDHFNWLIAGSVGANENICAESLGWDENTGINDITLWVALGIRLKNDLNVTPFVNKIPEIYGEQVIVEDVNEFLMALKNNQLATCQKLFSEVESLFIRAKYAITAAVFLGEATPENWKFYVHRICLVNEKPYLPFARVLR